MDDFFEAYFGESDGDEFEDIKVDRILTPKNKTRDKLKLDDSFKIFKVNDNGEKEY